MKSQLQEDIGQSATLSLVPSGKVSNSSTDTGMQDIAPAPAATLVRPRAESGVWRQKSAAEPVVLAAQQPEEPLPMPAEVPLVLPEPVHEVINARAEPTLAADPTQGEPVMADPLFDFTPSPWSTPAPERIRREPTWFERSGKRYLVWGSCLLSAALVVGAGLWIVGERKDSTALALVADELKVEPVDKAVRQRTIAAKEFTLNPDGQVRVTPAVRVPVSVSVPVPVPVPQTAPPVPPLVLLAPEPAAETKDVPAAAPVARREVPRTAPKPERVKVKRAPERQVAPAPVVQEKKPEPVSAMAATLKACREYGYHEAQCVKRGCSMTKYGFVCRGK